MTKKMEKTNTAATPLGRLGTPEEMASFYCFLAPDEASDVTGALWSVDGGLTIGEGPVGLEARRAAKRQPEQELKLEHSMDGLRDRDYHSSL